MRRRLIQLGLFLMLGAIVNVAVAWGFSLWGAATFGTRDHPLITPEQVQWAVPEGWEALLPVPYAPDMARDCSVTGLLAIQIGVRREYLGPDAFQLVGATHQLHYLATGWPFHSCSCWGLLHQQALDWHCALDAPAALKARDAELLPLVHYARPLPLRPLPLGFTINTLFYGAILWTMFAAPFALRRRRRIKRGLCPACAYPVGRSEVCTECGCSLSDAFSFTNTESRP
jgi:hypothetical protein